MSAIDIQGKVSVVTGASRGIGKECALTLAGAGSDVALVATNRSLLKEVASAEVFKNRNVKYYTLDVSKINDVEKTISEILKDFGRIDILVNNAGVTRDNLILRMKEDDWDRVLEVNLKGAFNFIKSASKIMLKQKSGRIINLSSVSGIVGNPGQANYSAAKAGIIGLTRSVAKELASRQILVNCIAPGFIETDMTASMDENNKAVINNKVPLGRIGKPFDIAGAVLFLASNYSNYITGQTIVVDGGLTISNL